MKERIVDLDTYKVLESMVKDKLISGLPFSEYKNEETTKEFHRRLDERKKNRPTADLAGDE